MENLMFSAETITRANERDIQKPNEDAIISDVENQIFILLDGITRPHNEYLNPSQKSAALEASETFAKNTYEYILTNSGKSNKEELLRDAARHANAQIKKLRDKKSLEEWGFYPATLGIIAMIDNGILHYLAVGDCSGVLLRGSSRMIFGKEFSLDGVDLLAPTKAERYQEYCNRKPSFLSYTVYNGDEWAPTDAEYSYFHVEKGDVILFVTDGAGDLVKYEKQSTLKSSSLDDLLVISEKYDIPPFANYADDKSIIRIRID